jgi:hypothetical protein
MTMHYSGGVLYQTKSGWRRFLPGWPCCCSGDRAVKIAHTGMQTNLPYLVTCSRCLKAIEAAAETQKRRIEKEQESN